MTSEARESERPSVREATPRPASLSWLTRLLLFLPSLRAQLIVPYVLLTVLIAMLGTYIITQLVTASFRESFVNRLHEASRVAADGIVRRERVHLDNLRVMAFTDGVWQAVSSGDAVAVRDLLEPLALNYRVDIVRVSDRQGRELITLTADPASQEYLASQGADLSNLALVANVLRPPPGAPSDKFVDLLNIPQSEVYLMTSAPVRGPEQQIVGVVMIGTRLISLLTELQNQANADVVGLGPDGKLLATTLVEPDEGYESLELEAQVAYQIDLAETRDLVLNQRSYQADYAPLLVQRRRVGVLAVVLPSSYVVSAESTSRNSISVVFALVTGAVILVGYLLAQNIARPILRLRHISQAVASGDLEQTSDLNRPDEIGELAAAFDTMTLRLRERTAEAARLYAETVQRNKELAAINARLQSTQRQLVQSEKLAAVGQLTAGIVHDVRNPLAVIIGLAEIALEDYRDHMDPKLREHVTTIRDSATRANRIVGDLLKFARQSTAEMQYQDLKATLQAVIRLTAFTARQAHVQVVTDLPEQPVWATYDAQQIEQVLINLIQNAVHAMGKGGTLRINLSQAESGEAVAIAVQDTGIGIPPENLNRIFDPFFTTKPEGEGTGLGLSVSYGIIQDHHGQIEVESVVGQGTTFTLLLPVQPLTGQRPAAASEAEAAGSLA